MSVENPIHVSNHEELRTTLEKFQINYLLWLSGRKNTGHLLKEIEDGETELVQNPEHGLVRQTHVATIEVLFRDEQGDEFILTEDRQVWRDKKDAEGNQRIDRRGYTHLSEKVSVQEVLPDGSITPEAINRALQEELAVNEYSQLSNLGVVAEVKDSSSFPGLKTKYILHKYRVVLPPSEFKTEYVEEGKEKSTYFVWQPVATQ